MLPNNQLIGTHKTRASQSLQIARFPVFFLFSFPFLLHNPMIKHTHRSSEYYFVDKTTAFFRFYLIMQSKHSGLCTCHFFFFFWVCRSLFFLCHFSCLFRFLLLFRLPSHHGDRPSPRQERAARSEIRLADRTVRLPTLSSTLFNLLSFFLLVGYAVCFYVRFDFSTLRSREALL